MRNLCVLIILLMSLGLVQDLGYSQSLKKTRIERAKIRRLLKKADKKILAEKLKAFSSKTLRILLKSYGLPTKKGDKPLSKKQLIDTIIKNISILSMSKKGKMPLSKKKSKTKKAKTKLSKTKLGETLKGKSELSTSKASTRRSTLTQIEGESTQNPSSFVTYRAEVAYGSNDEDEKGYRHAFMFGRVEITFSNKTLYADSVKVKLNKDGEPVEILAVGDILLEDKNHNRIVGEKIYFFPMIERAIFYKGQGLDKPFYVRGKVAHGVADSKYIFYKGLLTTCNLERPHYSINFSKAWYYDDQLFWAQDANYKIGNSVLLYTPFFYRSAITTGIRTAFGYERGINWFLHNTLAYIPGLSAEETLKRVNKKSSFEMRQSKLGMRFELDYYQKMGVQFGYELLYRDGGNMLLVDLGLAKDRSVKYDAGTQELILNYFDQDGDGVPEETNNFRWNIRTEGKFAIYSSSVFNSVLDLGFKTQSDPFYQNQFEKHRHQEFNIFDLLGLDDTNPDIVGGDRSLLSSSTGQQIRFGLANKLYGLTFQLSGDFGYLLQRDITDVWNPPKNPYTTDYYKNYKSIFLFPKIALGYTGSIMILGDEKPKLESDKQKEDLEKKRNETKYIKEFEGKSGYNPETQDNINTRNIVQPDVYLSADVKRKDRLVVNMPINYSLNFDFSEKRTYGTDQQNDLETDVFNDSSKLNLSIPLTLTYQFVKFSVTSSGSLKNQNQYTKEPDITEKQNDKELTYTNWDASFGGNLDFFFLEKYKYLELKFGGGVTYNLSDRFDEVYKKAGLFLNESGRSEGLNYNLNLTFFKTTFTVSFNDDLYISAADLENIARGISTEEQILKEQEGNLSFSVTNNTLDFLTVNNTLNRSRSTDKNISNNLMTSLKLLGHTHLFGPVYINQISYSLLWNKNFEDNTRLDKLMSSLMLDLLLTKNWNFVLAVQSNNEQLYRYSQEESAKYGFQSRDFFQDLLDSFNFFDTSKRESSFFNMNSLNFALKHDLHDWMMEFQVDLTVKRIGDGPWYFEPTLYFIMYVKEMPSFRYPKVRQVYTKQ